MASTQQGDSGDFGFQIAPMVDVVFVLLIFFMACAGIREKFLTVPVPGGGAGNVPVSIFVNIDAAGNVTANGSVLAAGGEKDLGAVREFVEKAVRTSREDVFVIRPSGEARHERVVAVVDACRSANAHNLVFGIAEN